ncbi:MAG: C1 family peptidase [Bacteroidetes bacterium]|nr:C1 family peptidase [Bacteroidota bacterium]
MARNITWYGWRPDLPDQRDLMYSAPHALVKKLPAKVDLSPDCPPVYDQGELGSCTANAIGAAFEFELMKQSKSADFMPSRLFIYYNERVMENTISVDNGAEIRDGIKSVNKQGVCPETMLPYDIQKFTVKPKAACFKEALKHQVLSYHRVQRSLDQMKSCLAEGYPFVFGFTVYDAFESETVAKTGKLSLPGKTEKVVGGHAVMAVGYDDKTKRFIVRNSWGSDWGLKGYFTIPYAYITNSDLSDDFWTIRVIES